MRNILMVLAVFALFSIFNDVTVFAAKKFVPKRAAPAAKKKSTGNSGVYIPSVAKYRGDKQGILLSFANFNGIESADYSFTYNSNGVPQGAGGTIRSSNNPTAQRELLFGTCSSGVCTYHHNLTNAQLSLTVHFTNGSTSSKTYRIKTYQ
jgi:hypothetical protein